MVWRKLFGKPAADDVEPAEALRLQRDGALLVDVREPDEWRSGHAKGARHIPLGTLQTQVAKLPRDRDVLFICASGSRSRAATDFAQRSGLTSARNVGGGMSAWMRAGLPVSH